MKGITYDFYPELKKVIERFDLGQISEERGLILQYLVDYIQSKVIADQEVNVNFICTHNSRRSQLAQIWAQTAADYHRIKTRCYSGGVEVTAFNQRAVEAIMHAGFHVSEASGDNPRYSVSHSPNSEPIIAFSKGFDDKQNQATRFAAVMTCAHADKNCPVIPGAEIRIPIRYHDTKEFDGTPLETSKYKERCLQIGFEMFYVFSKIKK